MIRTGYEKDGELIPPFDPTELEIIATVNHINQTNLASAKMFLGLALDNKDGKEFIEKAIKLIELSMSIERQAIDKILEL